MSEKKLSQPDLIVEECPNNCQVLVFRLRSPLWPDTYLMCGCLSASFARPSVKSGPFQGNSLASLTVPIHRCKTVPQCRAVIARLLGIGENIAQIFSDSQECDYYRHEGSMHGKEQQQILGAFEKLLENPDSFTLLQDVFSKLRGFQALAHLDVVCDKRGDGSLIHKCIVYSLGRTLKYVGKSQSGLPDLAFEKVLTRSENLFATDNCEMRQITKKDPLHLYVTKFDKSIDVGPLVLMGKSSREIPYGSCDIDPYCKARSTCKLLTRKPVEQGNKTKRLYRSVALDLLFLKECSDPESHMAPMMLIQMSSLFMHMKGQQTDLEDLLLKASSYLPYDVQRHYYRYFLDRCLAMKDTDQKGSAFERLTRGLLQTVPCWSIGDGRKFVRNKEKANEIDLAISVHLGKPESEYWYREFGPRIMIECKNYPGLLPEKNKEGISYVKKFHTILKRSRVKLGILMNTGRIHDNLWTEAQRTYTTEALVVLFDGRDVFGIIDSPGDAATYIRENIADAKMGVIPTKKERNSKHV